MHEHGITVTTNKELDRANALFQKARYEDAAGALIALLRSQPGNHEAHALLGMCAMKLGALMQAETFLRKAIALGSRDRETRRALASVMSQQERPDKALPLIDELLAEKPDTSLRAMKGGLLEKLGRNIQSRDIFADLTSSDPGNLQAWVSYGHCLRAAGQTEEAIEAYRQAIKGMEDYGEAWWSIASIKRKVFSDEDLAALRSALSIAVDLRNEAPLHFALARALHDRGEYAEAFENYEKGNALRADALGYDPNELSEEIDETISLTGAHSIDQSASLEEVAERPIFIISLPRSGSTLVEQILASHPLVDARGELPYIPAILRSYMELAFRHGRVSVSNAIASLNPDVAKRMGEDYLARAALHRNSEAPYFVDKLPHNWSNILFIKKILPQALFIDIRRPAMDCCFSNYTQSFTSAHASSFDLRHMARSYKDNVRLMDHLAKVAPNLLHRVSYTTLVENPEPTIRGMLEYVGLPWNPAVLEFHRNKRLVRTPSSEQVRRPINRDGMEVWRPYEQWLGALRDELGELAEA